MFPLCKEYLNIPVADYLKPYPLSKDTHSYGAIAMDNLNCNSYNHQLVEACEDVEEDEELYNAEELAIQQLKESYSQVGRGIKRPATDLVAEQSAKRNLPSTSRENIASNEPSTNRETIATNQPSTSRNHISATTPTFLDPTCELWLTFGASLAFLIIGLVRGYSASALPSIEAIDPDLIQSSEQKSWIGAIPPLGAFLGSMLSGAIMQRAGRKRTLQMAAPLWAAGWLLLGFAPSFPLVLLGRFVSGLCVGITLAPSQVYVSECCDPEIRGRLGSLPTLSMSFGIVISYVAGSWLYWRHLAFLSATFCGALFMVLLPLPESPVWLETRGLDASASIKWLHLSSRATAVVKDDHIPEKSAQGPVSPPPSLFTREVFCSSAVIKPLIVGFALLFFQQFSGIDAVIFFTVEIFQSAGSKLNPMTATIIVGVVQLVCNGVSTMVVDRAGRRPLLLLSGAIMCASMLAMGTAYYMELQHSSWLGYLPVASLVVFMVGFSLGFGGLPFLLLGELFPAHYRSQLSAMASAVNLLSMFAVIKSFHALETVLTSAGTFWMYACFCALAFFFVLFMVPETKGKSLAEIEEHFRGEHKSNAVKLQKISTISRN